MTESEKSRSQLHEERKVFVEKAMQEGAHLGMKRKTVDIGLVYTFNDELTLADIATQIYPEDNSGRANTFNHFRKFMRTLIGRVSYTLGSEYNSEELLVRKPDSLLSREKRSTVRGGTSVKLKRLIEEDGITDFNKLVQELGRSRDTTYHSLGIIEGWGVDTSAVRKRK